MNQRKRISILLFVGLACNMAVGQQSDTIRMTLKECMEYAVANSTKMRIQAADRSDEQWARRQAIMQAFTPSVSAQTYAYNQYGRNLDPESNTYNTVTTFYNGFNVSGGINLFNGFQAINNLRMASVAEKMGFSKEQQTRDAICLATMEAYYNVLYYKKLEAVLEEQVQVAKSAKNLATRQEELGQKGHADVAQMESELTQKQYQLVTTRNKKQAALMTLKDVMYWPADKSFFIDETIGESLTPMMVPDTLTQYAKHNLPSAEIARMNLTKATLDLKSARGAYSPKLGLYGGWSTTYYTYPGLEGYTPMPFEDQFKNNGGEYVQLSLIMPIFDQLQRRKTVNQKKNSLTRAQAEYDQTMRDIENEVSRAVNDRDGASAAYQQAKRMTEVQEEAFHLSQKQYENGLISSIEYQTASQSYLNAVAECTNALFTLRIKEAVLRYYNGESYINQ